MDDTHSQDVVVPPTEAQTPETLISSQPNGSTPTDMPPEAPESPTNASTNGPVERQSGAINTSESDTSKRPNEAPMPEPVQSVPVESAPSAPAPQTPLVPQMQSPAQQDQTGFIRALLAKANAKLHSNRQKKLDNLMLMTQKKRIIANDDVQKLLRVSDATATRYLVKLVQQGRLARVGNPRDAKYQYLR